MSAAARLCLLGALLRLTPIAFAEQPSGDNLLPDPGFEDPEVKAWRGTPGWVTLDDATAATGRRSYCLKTAPEQALVHLEMTKPLALRAWCWYEVSYAYRIEPPVHLDFYLTETDEAGLTFSRTRSEYGPRFPPPGQFGRASFRFLSRPGTREFRLTANAQCRSPQFLPGRVWLDDLSLRLVGPAESSPPQELALFDPSFEGTGFFGYAFREEYLTVLSPTAKAGSKILRKAQGQDGKFVIELVEKEMDTYGHLYRAAVWARGEGSCFVNFPVQGSVFYDYDPREATKRFPLDKTEWRQVYLDMVVDRPGVELTGMNVWFWGEVEFDLASVTRLR